MAGWSEHPAQTLWIDPRATSFACACDECRRGGVDDVVRGTIARGVEAAVVRCSRGHRVHLVRATPLPALA
jgi:hypothetical protein